MQQANQNTSLEALLKQAELDIKATTDSKSLDDLRVHYLGKKGLLTEQLKSLGQLSQEARPAAGAKINEAKTTIQTLIDSQADSLTTLQINKQLTTETLDITLPGRKKKTGSIHPITQTIETLRDIFTRMGFQFVEGPEIEDDYHNFTSLNIPPLHPARGMADTFYFPDNLLLRTQMSSVQIRAMKAMPPPMRIVSLGRVYRREFDLTHTPMFHQMECVMIDESVSFADLKGLLKSFLKTFFTNDDIAIRFRPSYFPFTEPSAEVDIGCIRCHGKGCRICKQTGWLEVLGCGMVHPVVLKEAGINPDTHQGLSFGVGVDRLAMLKYELFDLRALFENDLRFLNQFNRSVI